MTDSQTENRPAILIAGGSGSVGVAIARLALKQGWAVVIHGRNADKAAALLDELRRLGPAEAVLLDIHGKGAARQLVDDAAAIFGRLDAVVDCTATGVPGITGLLPDTDPDCYGAFYDVSAAWFQRLSHAAYPHLKRQGGTLIAFISDAGRFAAPHQTVIGAARAATIGFVRNLAMEAARDGIRAHVISPSYVADSDSAKRMGSERMAKAARRAGLGLPTAEDIAPLAMFLCGDGATKMTGQVISVNGGLNA